MSRPVRGWLKMQATRHRPSGEPNVLIQSLPRSGSTWLMELILTQPGFRACPEPLNIRKDAVMDHLGLRHWKELHRTENLERIIDYLRRLRGGKLRDPRFRYQSPLSKFYRPITTRTVFKIIHAAEEHVDRLASELDARVLFLIRHPIPVTLSRSYYPKLDTILDSDLREHFTDTQMNLAERIIAGGSKLECGILDWCLRNYVAVASRKESWTIISYEQLVLDPGPVVTEVCERCELPDPEAMLKQLSVPSGSTALSSAETRERLDKASGESDRQWLVEKWRPRVSNSDMERAGEILAAFGLDEVYRVDRAIPESRFWISPRD